MDGNGVETQVNEAIIVAQRAGQAAGADYSLLDVDAPSGNLLYMLETVSPDGQTIRTMLVHLRDTRLFLPLIQR